MVGLGARLLIPRRFPRARISPNQIARYPGRPRAIIVLRDWIFYFKIVIQNGAVRDGADFPRSRSSRPARRERDPDHSRYTERGLEITSTNCRRLERARDQPQWYATSIRNVLARA